MVFGRHQKESTEFFSLKREAAAEPAREDSLLVLGPAALLQEAQVLEALRLAAKPLQIVVCDPSKLSPAQLKSASGILAVYPDVQLLENLLDQAIRIRESRGDGTPYLIIVSSLKSLTALGVWLHQRAVMDRLEGIRLIASDHLSQVLDQLEDKLDPILESNVIKMPVNPEVPNPTYKYFYAISPSIRSVVRFMKELAENNIARIYLLGAPGAGKTSLAYHYYLCRGKGNFVSVNLTAESTGDKAAMKSLLCGHVSGAMPGVSGSREGALSFAHDGVCFLDESHGVTSVVMEVLMEVLDSGQYLPFGAAVKRALECAVIFASNRSWETLRDLMHLDEHARLGATIIKVKDLAAREEDMVAVLAATLAKFRSQCTTWTPPEGLTERAWQQVRNCPWRGNVRTLIRVIETACVSFCVEGNPNSLLLDEKHILEGINLWEPTDHKDANLFVSHR